MDETLQERLAKGCIKIASIIMVSTTVATVGGSIAFILLGTDDSTGLHDTSNIATFMVGFLTGAIISIRYKCHTQVESIMNKLVKPT